MKSKKSLLVGVAATAVLLGGGIGAVSAATPSTSSSNNSSLVDKLVSKFNLNKADVQKVFDEDRSAQQASREADQASRLATAVKDGKLTQAQADYITKTQAEIKALMGTGAPSDQTDAVRDQVKAKMDALNTWAKENNVDTQYIGHGGGPRGGMHGSDMPADASKPS